MILPEISGLGIYNSQVITKNIITTKKRIVSKFEIELPIDSGGTTYIDSRVQKIAPKYILCAKPGQTRCTKLPYKCYYIHLETSDSFINETLSKTPDFVNINDYEYYSNIFNQMLKYDLYTDNSKNIIIYSLILKLIYSLENESKNLILSKKTDNLNSKVIQDLLEYISENIAGDLSLSVLSNICGYSAIHLHNSFKKYTGKTPRAYIEELRIKKAISLMLTTDKNLTEIAYECGFSSQSYFSYVFKQKNKLSPREYVKKVAKHYEI